MSIELDRLAEAHGIGLSFISETGEERWPSDEAKRRLLGALGIAAGTDEEVRHSLAALEHPRCYMPAWLENGRAWGITCQLYGLRSERNCGIGDFEDLARLCELVARAGADFVGVNPLHALFFSEARHFSPYAPSSRHFLNPLFIAVDAFESPSEPNREARRAAQGAELVDYEAVARLKRKALEAEFARFQADHLTRAAAFETFTRNRGRRLEDFALFEALSEHMMSEGRSCGWHGWPEDFKDKGSAAVRRFRERHPDRILFHMWLQWIAREQLANVQARAQAAGMRLGLYIDLAVGVAQDGADTWAEPDAVLRGVRVGAPPDAFNARGQDWGLAPISPRSLQADHGGLFGQLISDAIGPAAALRIDHVMSLMRLYLIADGLDGTEGAYVHYPLHDMLVALGTASRQARAIVIGEDLGTVPPNFREIMRAARILGYRVLFFEREVDGRFRLPQDYEHVAMACISTHDLPTLRGWWEECDLDDRERIGLDTPDIAANNRTQRVSDRERMIGALAGSGLLPDRLTPVARGEQPVPAELPQEIAIALSRFLARTPSRLVAVQLEDLVGMRNRANLPGTIDEHPNWQRKLPLTLEALPQSSGFTAITQAVAEERPRSRD